MYFVSTSLTNIVKLRLELRRKTQGPCHTRSEETIKQSKKQTYDWLLTQSWIILMNKSSRCKSNQQSYRSKWKKKKKKNRKQK